MIDIGEIICELSHERPIFHSEKDFQHAFAWKLHELYPKDKIRLEKRVKIDGASLYIDIVLYQGNSIIFFELKYKTKIIAIEFGNEEYSLTDQSACDVSRYDVLSDISRLEKCVGKYPNSYGFAIFVTNDMIYLGDGRKKDSNDKEFKLRENRAITGILNWKEGTSKGTMKGREDPIILQNSYLMKWSDYSNLKMKNGAFKYLLNIVNTE